MSDPIYILDCDAWNGSQVVTLRFSTHSFITRASDAPANTFYDGRIVDAGRFERSIFDGGGLLGSPSAGVGAIVLNNQDGGLDHLYNYGFDGRAFTLSEMPGTNAPLSSKTVLLSGVLSGIDSGDAFTELILRLRDPRVLLDTALLTERYAGTSTSSGLGAEGDTDLTDKIKPVIFGAANNVPTTTVNPYDLIKQVSARPCASIIIYDGGLPLDNAGNTADLASLEASSPSPGGYTTCLSLGLIKLGGTPVFDVTADVVEGTTLADRSAARVVQRILNHLDDPSISLNAASFDALHAARPDEVGIYIDGDATALSVIGSVLQSIGAALIPEATGVLRVALVSEPQGAPVAAYSLRHIVGGSIALNKGPTDEGDGVPAWSVLVKWGRIWFTQASSQLAGAVSETRKTYLATEVRESTAQDNAVLTAHPLAAELTIETLLTTQADADAEAIRRLSLHSVRRDYPSIAVHRDDATGVSVGDEVAIDINRFGFNGGKNFIVVGRADDFNARTVELRLWG